MRARAAVRYVCGAAAICLLSVTPSLAVDPPSTWVSELGRDHPLAGKIYKATGATLQPIDAAQLLAALGSAKAIVLGETHDNADHHLWQAWLIRALSATSNIAVIFEQLRVDQQPVIDALQVTEKSVDVAAFKNAIDWEQSGWPEKIFEPLFETALAAKLPIYAGDPQRSMIRRVAKEGAAALADAEWRRLALSQPLGAALDSASLDEIEGAHCGAMPRSAFNGMAVAQRYRDAHLADAVLAALDRGAAQAVLIAGDVHARLDRGVPWYLAKRRSDVPRVSVHFLEVADGLTDPAAYGPRSPDEALATDYLVMTARGSRDDPCAQLRAKPAGNRPGSVPVKTPG